MLQVLITNYAQIDMKKYTEENLQNSCYVWFTNTYGLKTSDKRCKMFSVPNELAMTIRGALIQTKLPKKIVDQIISTLVQKFRNTGLSPGVSDTICILPGKTVYVEFKTPEGVQSDSQKEFEKIVTALDQKYYVIRTLEQFKEMIKNEFN